MLKQLKCPIKILDGDIEKTRSNLSSIPLHGTVVGEESTRTSEISDTSHSIQALPQESDMEVYNTCKLPY